MILPICIFLFTTYVAILTFIFYHAGNLFSLNFKKPKPEVYQFTEEDKKALEDYRRRKEYEQS